MLNSNHILSCENALNERQRYNILVLIFFFFKFVKIVSCASINRVKMVMTEYREDLEGAEKRYIQLSRYLFR